MIKRNYMLLIIADGDQPVEYFDTYDQISTHIKTVSSVIDVEQSFIFQYDKASEEFTQVLSAKNDDISTETILKAIDKKIIETEGITK